VGASRGENLRDPSFSLSNRDVEGSHPGSGPGVDRGRVPKKKFDDGTLAAKGCGVKRSPAESGGTVDCRTPSEKQLGNFLPTAGGCVVEWRCRAVTVADVRGNFPVQEDRRDRGLPVPRSDVKRRHPCRIRLCRVRALFKQETNGFRLAGDGGNQQRSESRCVGSIEILASRSPYPKRSDIAVEGRLMRIPVDRDLT
jgi:hypothetical protein